MASDSSVIPSYVDAVASDGTGTAEAVRRSFTELRLLSLAPSTYATHSIHSHDRIWTETNCYVDLWIELLHSLGADPIPALAFVLSADCDGRQWDFVKMQSEDLRVLYGIDVHEMNVWRPVLDHIREGLEDGVLNTVEVDGFWLPDTSGTSYRNNHTKTTIVPNSLDETEKVLGYFHNRGYFELSGADFDGVFNLAPTPHPEVLLPYVEQIRLGHNTIVSGAGDRDLDLARAHFARRPSNNPVDALARRVIADIPLVQRSGPDAFHLWSFGLLRQCGASAELAADLCGYLEARGVVGIGAAVPHFLQVAQGAKAVQFRMARAARGRAVSLEEPLAEMTASWSTAMDVISIAL
ncbi:MULTISPECIES: DUF1839 family protein [unclassified Rhodococcus (in: high G+C Gram-positive bacteria)]|uniref:DUF1839 family protein n=1 Tax=unclassified Rhodococcus (in: high G+C Gram-positive bacteria) TaxID=192944 RepID=UPI001FF9B090|nr:MULTISPECIES: DUF1839 family protein [unclassified Rhodococcus (in: high G+C Gram-positive bacteria)]